MFNRLSGLKKWITAWLELQGQSVGIDLEQLPWIVFYSYSRINIDHEHKYECIIGSLEHDLD